MGHSVHCRAMTFQEGYMGVKCFCLQVHPQMTSDGIVTVINENRALSVLKPDACWLVFLNSGHVRGSPWHVVEK
jgi:hypothetical protein